MALVLDGIDVSNLIELSFVHFQKFFMN